MFDTYSAHLDRIREQHAEMIRAGLEVETSFNINTPPQRLVDRIRDQDARIALLEEQLEVYKRGGK